MDFAHSQTRSHNSTSVFLEPLQAKQNSLEQEKRELADSLPSSPFTSVMQLQKSIGNQSVQQFMRSATIQKKENKTGLPDQLKNGLESLSGMDLSNVHVHYNSNKPAQIGALAYAQGSQIYLGPGQEQHLPHEGWHVVQQRQGRVKPTRQLKGVAMNQDRNLEREADVMGHQALVNPTYSKPAPIQLRGSHPAGTVQTFPPRYVEETKKWEDDEMPGKVFASEKAAVNAYIRQNTGNSIDEAKEYKKRMYVKERMRKLNEEQERETTRRKSPRTLEREEKDRKAQEKFQLPGKPKLHRGNSFEDLREHRKSKAIAKTRASFMEQLPDSKGRIKRPNTSSEDYQNEAKELYHEFLEREEIKVHPDERGRPKRVIARLDGFHKNEGSKNPPDPIGQMLDTDIDDRGHLVTESLVGPSRSDQVNRPSNIIAENRLINQGYKRGLELAVEDQLALGKNVVYMADVTYEGSRAVSVVHNYVIDGEQVVSVQLNNPDKDIMK